MHYKKTLLFIFLFISSTIHAAYIHLDQIRPGQLRFSSKNVEEKIQEAIQLGDIYLDVTENTWKGNYFQGKSFLSEKEALPVIKWKSHFVLADGHHHVLAAKSLNLLWIPVKEIADLSNLDKDEFWQVAAERGWAYLYDLDGNKNLPPDSFDLLQDDPNRYFAAITARKYPDANDLSLSKGAEYPLWLKIGKDIPFIEFHISDTLMKENFIYDYQEGKNPSVENVEEARNILKKHPIAGLRVVPKRIHHSKLQP